MVDGKDVSVGGTDVLVDGVGVFDACIVAAVDWGALQDASTINTSAKRMVTTWFFVLFVMTRLPMRFCSIQKTL